MLAALIGGNAPRARDAAVARRLDRAGGGGGRILTGWELAQEGWSRRCGQTPRDLTLSLAGMAVADAAAAAGQIPLGKAAPVRPLGRSLGAIALLWAAVAVLAVCLPGLAWTQWNRFSRPFDDVPPFSQIEFKVTPGQQAGGLWQRIGDPCHGHRPAGRAIGTGAPLGRPRRNRRCRCFPRRTAQWRAVLAKVVEPTDYYVRAYRARSNRYHISIITVPLIENARLRIEPPAYANRAAYEGPMPKEGVSGLPGTKVQIFLHSNRPLRGGSIMLSGAAKPTRLPMKPSEAGQPGGRRAVLDRRRRKVRLPRDRRGRARSRSSPSRAT